MYDREVIEAFVNEEHWYLEFKNLGLEGVKHLSPLITHVQSLNLRGNNLKADSVIYLAEGLKTSLLTSLDLGANKIGNEGVSYLGKVLKETKITYLDLSENDIGNEGCDFLSDGIRDGKIEDLRLGYNRIGDKGVQSLVEAIEDNSSFVRLDLTRNKVTTASAPDLRRMINTSNKRRLWVDIHDPKESFYISQFTEANFDNTHLIIHQNRIGENIAEYISENFQQLYLLTFTRDDICDVTYFKKAFDRIKILKFKGFPWYLKENQYSHNDLINIFENSCIVKLEKYKSPNVMGQIFSFVKTVNVFQLEINHSDLEIDTFNHDWLVGSNIRHLDTTNRSDIIEWEEISDFCNSLKDTKLVKLQFCNIEFSNNNFDYLLKSLNHSQLVHLSVQGNRIEYYSDTDILKDTQICWIDCNEEIACDLNASIVLKNREIHKELNLAFENVVHLNPANYKLEFTTPKNPGPLRQYTDFIKILSEDPKRRAHIIYNRWEFSDDIDEFVENIRDRFTRFINSDALCLGSIYNSLDFVEMVNEFVKSNFRDLVQNLLLHRSLYYVDNNNEILHPLIYKLLHSYELPLYHDQIEPNKKFDIINYYKEHSDIEGAPDLIEFLQNLKA